MWEHMGWAKEHEMIIGNTIFCQPPRRLWTWKSPGDNMRNQIDYVIMKTRFRNSLISCKAYPGADFYSDHVPIISTIRLKLKKLKNTKKESLLDYAMLSTDPDLRRLHSAEVRNKFKTLQGLDSIEKQWGNLRECINKTAKKVIPKVKRKAKQKWMNDEILILMENRRELKRNSEEYETVHRMIRAKCKEAKELWPNENRREVEDFHRKDLRSMYKKINDITGRRKACSSTGCIKSTEG